MQIAINHVVAVHYNLRDDKNELIDSTYDKDKPMVYLHGRRQMITGFETAVASAAVGDPQTDALAVNPAKPGTSRPHTSGDRIAVVMNYVRAKHQTDHCMLLGGGHQTSGFTQIVSRAKPSGESEATALIDHQGFLGQHKSRTVLLHFDFAPTVCREQPGPFTV